MLEELNLGLDEEHFVPHKYTPCYVGRAGGNCWAVVHKCWTTLSLDKFTVRIVKPPEGVSIDFVAPKLYVGTRSYCDVPDLLTAAAIVYDCRRRILAKVHHNNRGKRRRALSTRSDP